MSEIDTLELAARLEEELQNAHPAVRTFTLNICEQNSELRKQLTASQLLEMMREWCAEELLRNPECEAYGPRQGHEETAYALLAFAEEAVKGRGK